MDRTKFFLIVALAFCAGWMIHDLGREQASPMIPVAQAADIVEFDANQESLRLLTTSADGRTICAWAFISNPGDPEKLPELRRTEIYQAE